MSIRAHFGLRRWDAGEAVDLVPTLEQRFKQGLLHFLRADRVVSYGDMMDVLEILRLGGCTKVGSLHWKAVKRPTRLCRPRQFISVETKVVDRDVPCRPDPCRNIWVFAAGFVCCAYLGFAVFGIAGMNGA